MTESVVSNLQQYEKPLTVPDFTDHLVSKGFYFLQGLQGKDVPGYGYDIPQRMMLPLGRILDLEQLRIAALTDKEPVAMQGWQWYQEHLVEMPKQERARRFPHHHPPEALTLDQMLCASLYGRRDADIIK